MGRTPPVMADTLNNGSKTSFYIKRISGLILLLLLAAVFFYSAISKLFSLDVFTWTFMDMGIKSTMFASVIAHLFIGLEFLIGLFLLFHIYLKQVTYPLTVGLLVLFTAYLVFLIISQGNTGSCGCFGDWIYMKPLTAIWKNLAMIAATVVLIYIYPVKPYKAQEWISAVLAMIAIVIPFILFPLETQNQPEVTSEPIELQLLYKPGFQNPPQELKTGKHIIAFMSLTCPHCKKAAYLLHIIQNNHPDFPIFLVLNGHPSNEKQFFDETHAQHIPHILYRNTDDFIKLAGPGVPAIYWVNNGIIERKSNYYQLDPEYMQKWLKQ